MLVRWVVSIHFAVRMTVIGGLDDIVQRETKREKVFGLSELRGLRELYI